MTIVEKSCKEFLCSCVGRVGWLCCVAKDAQILMNTPK